MFKFNLDKSSKKYHCPRCNKKTFVRFLDQDKNYIESNFGRCDREDRCGYFLKPHEDKTSIADFEPNTTPVLDPSFIDKNFIIPTLNGYKNNALIKWFIEKVGENKTQQLIELYRIGIDNTSSYTNDWVIFWQHDINNKCRSGKIIKYLPTGRRCKENKATWFHKKQSNLNPLFPDFNLVQCLFGEHLLYKFPTKPIAIVESEKTALIASLFIDKYIWLACGGLQELRAPKIDVLTNRSVTVFPDLGGFKKWEAKAREFDFNISRLIEDRATPEERLQGLDIGDYLL